MTARQTQHSSVCSVEGCGRRYYAKALCGKHYMRLRYSDNPNPFVRPPTPPQRCTVEGCEGLTLARGYCSKHYARVRRHGTPLPYIPPLSIEFGSPTALGRVLGVSRQRAHQLLFRNQTAARKAVHKALQEGKITKPLICMVCRQAKDNLEAHHINYKYKLAVIWLCVPCHNEAHPHTNPAGRYGYSAEKRRRGVRNGA